MLMVPRGKPGLAGLGGFFETPLGWFSSCFLPHCLQDSNLAEVLVALQALKISINENLTDKRIFTESDSSNTISWINGSSSPPWQMWDEFHQIQTLILKISNLSFGLILELQLLLQIQWLNKVYCEIMISWQKLCSSVTLLFSPVHFLTEHYVLVHRVVMMGQGD
ncbi:hypothetical protein JCGZ_12651 [Jatropha curcas]|uniref:RNase H type-1 domain-containing protein n=1 Tax=Jatropha curcas TaxID=180498 RepID=A0A067KH43_JATCU|nr:hypothetical protein JCGZ_12651 [Jatropha curcas]